MENETDKRIERLEIEVRALRLELDELKGLNSNFEQPAIQKNEFIQTIQTSQPDETVQPNPIIGNNETTTKLPEEAENHLVKLNKEALAKNKKPILIEKQNEKIDQHVHTPISKKQRSFEEVVLWLLPKIFMIILVLGVLWGLKVISDFGLFSNGLKIVLAYALSIVLIIIGIMMDLKKPEASQIFTIVLFGGAFIIGILTTAAGAILYDVLGLYLALFLALVYIAYGIAICYVKKNEVLSIFVIFTSLLLPYLLEYMDFNGIIILLYVLLVYGCIQFIFMKHIQTIAMYISYFFSIVAVQIIWSLNDERAGIYVASFILLNLTFLLVWWHLYKSFSKWRALHEGLFFALSCITVFLMNIIDVNSALSLLILGVIYCALAIISSKRNETRVVDIAGTLSVLIIFNIIIVLNAIDHLEIVLLPLSTFLGLMLGLKLNAKLMKIMYSILFTFFVLVHLIADDIEPFWTIEHLNYLFIFIYLLGLFIYLKQHFKMEVNKEGKAKVNFSLDIFPIFLAIYFFIYILNLDLTYISNANYGYFTAFVLAFVMISSLFISEKVIGRGLRYFFIFAFLLMYMNLCQIHYVYGFDIWLNIIVRIIYAIILIAIFADIYKKGYLYRTWISPLKLHDDGLLTLGILGTMVLLYSLLSQLQFDSIVNYFIVVTAKTLLLFITASISLWMSTNGQLRTVKVIGYCILAIAIMKLVFVDLDSLNLIIRAILFMIIGGIGLFLSNRLLSNKTKEV